MSLSDRSRPFAQRRDRGCVIACRILRLAERQIVPACRKRVQPEGLANVLEALFDPAGRTATSDNAAQVSASFGSSSIALANSASASAKLLL